MTISAKVIAASMTVDMPPIITFELEYPRFIHSEFMTHRVFSRNAASSRAIKVEKMIELVENNTAMPMHWGKDEPGMQANEEQDAIIYVDSVESGDSVAYDRKGAWKLAMNLAIRVAKGFMNARYHKQIVNRLLEPFTHIKVVVTSTSYDNFYNLRFHKDAQPEIKELSNAMLKAYDEAVFQVLTPGEWHTPYYKDGYWAPANGSTVDKHGVTLQDALIISSSCCAQVSYRTLDDTLEKAKKIFKRLIETQPVHASPTEHQAMPISSLPNPMSYYGMEGITGLAFTPEGIKPTSGNFVGWIQHRQLIPNNTCHKFDYPR